MNATSPLRLAPLGTPGPGRLPVVVGRESSLAARSAILSARCRLLAEQQADGSWRGRQEGDASLTARLLLAWQYLGEEDSPLAERLAKRLLDSQLVGGGWSLTPGGPIDLSASVLCYLALKLRGGADALAGLRSSMRAIRGLGGARATDGETRAWLRLFGQIDSGQLDRGECPPATAAAMATAPPRPVSPLLGIRELFAPAGALPAANAAEPHGVVNRLWRRVAGEEVEGQIEELTDEDLGLMTLSNDRLDTAAALAALLESGADRDNAAIRRACRWLITQADQETNPCEAAAMLAALKGFLRPATKACDDLPPSLSLAWADAGVDATDEGDLEEAARAATRVLAAKLVSAQDSDGGWGDNTALTAEAILALASIKEDSTRPTIDKAVAWLTARQDFDGGWKSSCSFPLGEATSLAIQALVAAGVDRQDDAVLAGVNWLLATQHDRGGWGEPGSSATASQTAWAVAALAAAGFATHAQASAGADWLIETQDSAGEWREPHFTSIDAPSATPVRNELHATIRGLFALSSWVAGGEASPAMDRPVCLRLAAVGTVED